MAVDLLKQDKRLFFLKFDSNPAKKPNESSCQTTDYFRGYTEPDDYLKRTAIQPKRKEFSAQEFDAKIFRSHEQIFFRAKLVQDDEMRAFHRTESLSNGLDFFLKDFKDFKVKNKSSKKVDYDLNDEMQKLARNIRDYMHSDAESLIHSSTRHTKLSSSSEPSQLGLPESESNAAKKVNTKDKEKLEHGSSSSSIVADRNENG